MTTLDKIELAILNGIENVRTDLDIEGDWGMILFLATDEDRVSILPLQHLLANDASKTVVGELLIPAAIRKFEAKAMGLIVSAWGVRIDASGTPEGEKPLDMLIPPSKHPQRCEILLMMLADQDTQRILSAEIKRPEGADHPELGEWKVEDADQFGGRFWDEPIKALRDET